MLVVNCHWFRAGNPSYARNKNFFVMPLPRLEFENAISVPVECNNLNNNFLKCKRSVSVVCMLFASRMLTPEEDKSTNLQVLEWLNCYIGKTGVLDKSRNLVVWHACSCELLEKKCHLRFESDYSFRFEEWLWHLLRVAGKCWNSGDSILLIRVHNVNLVLFICKHFL